ncbi:hypothetical protein F4861DRAFT_376595 [Xylaria intraflava]|nr:hypothetical protein F4861DRAFT_376595 [Xylaria intraflava]
MPITVRPASHPAREWRAQSAAATSAASLLEGSCNKEHSRAKKIIRSSFNQFRDTNIFPSSNGFVRAAYAAYSQHHHLTIRPEDVWFTILTQLSLHINANAEELRRFFVAHEGQKEVVVKQQATMDSADFGMLAICITYEMDKFLVDKSLRPWIMPDFTTTTHSDMVTAAVLMMGSMQKYFSYTMMLTCGIPSVTLLGEKDDWLKIRQRLDKLPELGSEPAKFASLLRPVLDYFIRSFDDPKDPEVLVFWSKIAHESPGGSGPSYLSGWITAFCFWAADGKPLYSPPQGDVDVDGWDPKKPGCDLGGTLFHRVDTEDIPDGYVSVPVKVIEDREYKTRMVAGSVGIEVRSSGERIDKSRSHNDPNSFSIQNGQFVPSVVVPEVVDATALDSLQPVSGWWMYELVDGA